MITLTEMAHRLRCVFYGYDPETTSVSCPEHLGPKNWLAVEAEVKRLLKEGESKFTEVYLSPNYIVPTSEGHAISEAKDCLVEDVCNAVKMEEIGQWVQTRPAHFASHDDVPEFLLPEEEEE